MFDNTYMFKVQMHMWGFSCPVTIWDFFFFLTPFLIGSVNARKFVWANQQAVLMRLVCAQVNPFPFLNCLQVVVSAKAILSVCPTADNNLTKMDAKIADCYRTIWQKLCQDVQVDGETKMSMREKQNLQDTVEYNRARIKQAKIVASQNLQDIDNIYKKVKAAMLW